jgi:hypothetical protein
MSRLKILGSAFLFLFIVLLSACNADSGAPHQLSLPEEGNSDEALYQQRCHDCHVPPLPQSRMAVAWPAIVERMQSHRITTGLRPLTRDEMRRIKAYLQRNAKDAT